VFGVKSVTNTLSEANQAISGALSRAGAHPLALASPFAICQAIWLRISAWMGQWEHPTSDGQAAFRFGERENCKGPSA